MYDSIKVQRFRAFDSFEISNLTRVNLLVGKNNAGKTSLLDAVEMVALGGRVTSLMRSPLRRTEVSLESQDERVRREPDVCHLFFGHRIREDTSFEVTGCIDSMKRMVRRSQSDRVQLDLLSEQAELRLPLEIEQAELGLPLEIVISGPDHRQARLGLGQACSAFPLCGGGLYGGRLAQSLSWP